MTKQREAELRRELRTLMDRRRRALALPDGELERWLLDSPTYGPSLRAWREQGAVSRKGKCYASLGMALGYGLFWWGAKPSLLLASGVGLFFLASAAYVLTRPSPQPLDSETKTRPDRDGPAAGA